MLAELDVGDEIGLRSEYEVADFESRVGSVGQKSVIARTNRESVGANASDINSQIKDKFGEILTFWGWPQVPTLSRTLRLASKWLKEKQI